VTWLWISAIEPQQADHSQHESGKEDRQQHPIESNLGCSLRLTRRGRRFAFSAFRRSCFSRSFRRWYRQLRRGKKDGFLRNGLLDDLLLVQVNQKSLD
jgi:hypothetical protein